MDSERILTQLRAEGYVISPDYEGADAVIVNTCGFLDSAKAESLAAIGEAVKENGKVIVTGCMGKDADTIRAAHPQVLAVTGPHQYEAVVGAVHDAVPPAHDPKFDLVPDQGLRLTPRHYAYLKISEGCNNRCSFCIIPSLRGDLVSRPMASVLYEAERLVKAGTKELLVISQDTSAYGVDIKYAESKYRGRDVKAKFIDMARELGDLGAWVQAALCLPLPARRRRHRADGGRQGAALSRHSVSACSTRCFEKHAPSGKSGKGAGAYSQMAAKPVLTLPSARRSSSAFPERQKKTLSYLLQWMREAKIERAGCFKYEHVDGAKANELPGAVAPEVMEERWHRFMAAQSEVSADIMASKVGREIDVLIDEVDVEEGEAIGRSVWDAPEIDGNVFLPNETDLKPGDMVRARVVDAEEYDLVGELV